MSTTVPDRKAMRSPRNAVRPPVEVLEPMPQLAVLLVWERLATLMAPVPTLVVQHQPMGMRLRHCHRLWTMPLVIRQRTPKHGHVI